MLAGQYRSRSVSGRIEEAITFASRAIRRCEQTGDLWFSSELSRIHGELYVMSEAVSPNSGRSLIEAEACFSTALETATQQGARSFELKAAISLARISSERKDHLKARGILETVCAHFLPDRTCVDLIEASRLLEEIDEPDS